MSLREMYAGFFGTGPAGLWTAPGRVNLIGEHTDYNDGFMLPLAIGYGVIALAGPNPDGRLRIGSAQYATPHDGVVEVDLEDLRPGAVNGWAAYVAGVAWSLREAGYDVGGLDVLVSGDVPQGAGLSSSAALECATALAMVDLHELDIDRPTLARLAQRAENDFVGMPCGILDQSASLLCVEDHALLLDARTLATDQVPLRLADEGLALLVIDTKAPHRHVDGEYAERRRSCERAAAELGVPALRDIEELGPVLDRLSDPLLRRRVRHVITENARVTHTVRHLRSGSTREIGGLLTESHVSLRDDYEVTVPQLDTAVDAALEAGALGARMTGGGFGGCVLALVEADTVDAVRTKVELTFAEHGFAVPEAFVATASAGARRLG